jgi:hypothetical protein
VKQHDVTSPHQKLLWEMEWIWVVVDFCASGIYRRRKKKRKREEKEQEQK